MATQGELSERLHNIYWEAQWQEAAISIFLTLSWLNVRSCAAVQWNKGLAKPLPAKRPLCWDCGWLSTPSRCRAGLPIDFPFLVLSQARVAGHCAYWISSGCSPNNMDVPPSLAVEACSLVQ